MRTFLKIAGIVLGLCTFGLIFTLIPDYRAPGTVLTEGFWAFGDLNRFLIALFGLLPAIVMIVLHYGRDERWHFEEWPYRLGRISCCAVIAGANFVAEMLSASNGPLTHAFSFFLNIFVIIYVLYSLIFCGPFKDKVSNSFFESYGLPVFSVGALLIIVALSYILAPSGIWLPQNIIIPIPIADYFFPISAYFCAILIVYELIAQLVSLPDQRSHSRGSRKVSNYGNFEYCSAEQMESYAKAACRKLNLTFERINGKVIYVNGFVSDKEFWGAMLDVSGLMHSNVDGWWVRYQ